MDKKEYEYLGITTFVQKSFFIGYVLISFIGPIPSIYFLANEFIQTDYSIKVLILGIPATLILWIVILLFFHISLNFMMPIIVSQRGLSIRVFQFWYRWKFIPWEEIQKVIKSPIPLPMFSSVTAVVLNKLSFISFIHIFFGLSYSIYNFSPKIIIFPQINNFDELIETIESNISIKDK